MLPICLSTSGTTGREQQQTNSFITEMYFNNKQSDPDGVILNEQPCHRVTEESVRSQSVPALQWWHNLKASKATFVLCADSSYLTDPEELDRSTESPPSVDINPTR